MLNALTIDVEDYHNVFWWNQFLVTVDPTEAVLVNTRKMLEILDSHKAQATFFVLGDVARCYPELVREIANGGHELGCHGFDHAQLFKKDPDQFRREVSDTRKQLEDISSSSVQGYRAPAFSVTPKTQWAFEVLHEAGFRYDSSVFPISGRRYGWPGFPAGICKVSFGKGEILEIPLTTVKVLGKSIPVCGGGYLRHFPYATTTWSLRRVQKTRPAVVYLHPYEIDCDPSFRLSAEMSASKRKSVNRCHRGQMRNRKTVRRKLEKLLSRFEFGPVRRVLKDVAPVSYSLEDSSD